MQANKITSSITLTRILSQRELIHFTVLVRNITTYLIKD